MWLCLEELESPTAMLFACAYMSLYVCMCASSLFQSCYPKQGEYDKEHKTCEILGFFQSLALPALR